MALWTNFKERGREDDFFGTDEAESDDDAIVQRRRGLLDVNGHNTSDVWGGLASRESAAVEEQHRALGYHETYESSQELTLQEGFKVGYCETFETACRIGKLLGQAVASKGTLQRQLQKPNPSTISHDGSAYLAAASRIREVLSATTAQDSSVSSDVERAESDSNKGVQPRQPLDSFSNLEREVEFLLGIDPVRTKGVIL